MEENYGKDGAGMPENMTGITVDVCSPRFGARGDAGVVRDAGDGGDPYAYISSLDATDSAVYRGSTSERTVPPHSAR